MTCSRWTELFKALRMPHLPKEDVASMARDAFVMLAYDLDFNASLVSSDTAGYDHVEVAMRGIWEKGGVHLFFDCVRVEETRITYRSILSLEDHHGGPNRVLPITRIEHDRGFFIQVLKHFRY